jgi:hypothetical protein
VSILCLEHFMDNLLYYSFDRSITRSIAAYGRKKSRGIRGFDD